VDLQSLPIPMANKKKLFIMRIAFLNPTRTQSILSFHLAVGRTLATAKIAIS
jgi:hypothetical protein